MGQGTEVKTREDPKVEIQEKGEVFFFYRPKVDKEEAHSPDDVQRMYVVLRPESAPDRAVEEKQAPDSGKEGKKRKTRHGGDEKGQADGGNEGGHGKEVINEIVHSLSEKSAHCSPFSSLQEVNVEEKPLLRLIVMGKKSLPDPAKHGRPFWGYVDLVTTDIEDVKDALKGAEYDTATRGKRHQSAARAMGEGVYRILQTETEEETGEGAGDGGEGGRAWAGCSDLVKMFGEVADVKPLLSGSWD
uniref:Uncharacterized protein n=1 Tax=Aegilops tauschii TaxID=37682 RepID=M8AIX0_AEGTA